ncbi:AAA family ATPase [Stenotrophomonas sp. GD04145]|uniref:ATP-dependent nuclease n=1 Tax=Stenotrophomonas sp. GD04145 TaxID=2975436 RepID=UPI00244ACA7E|nr:AAA family ATPase [Stenotrophomonas sp. GD04145]MDH0171317.1 AAA family ATPase [Stenotrophomonas sp. GD04145]
MHITRLKIRNFRSIREIDLPLAKTTVLIGPNNSGKTAILEALRIALTRRWGQRGTGFTEYDCRLSQDDSDPRQAPPIEIEIELTEQVAGEWGEDLQADLEDILQVDPMTNRVSVIMKVSCSWAEAEESYVPKWEFLGSDRLPLKGKGARLINMSRFFEYIPVFYLDALRDADDEFAARSQFWGRLLRSVNIPQALSKRSQQVLDRLNRRLLDADPKIASIAETLEGVGRVAMEDDPGAVGIRMVPLKAWDLISRAQVILKTSQAHPWLPLNRHGRGVQSLSVLFLFHAFVNELLGELFHADSKPFLALEEPETHLHPQAARTLWRHVSDLPGQKIVTTHSPYFVQNVPFRDLRLIRTDAKGTSFSSLPSSYEIDLPFVDEISAFVERRQRDLQYEKTTQRLIVSGKMHQNHRRDLMAIYRNHADHELISARIDSAYFESQNYVSDEVLADLEEHARRIRGEIFFARRWLIVEGQSDYILMHAIGEALDYSLDAHGVSVIDAQNNGSPSNFCVLARALRIPWLGVFDRDAAGEKYIGSISGQGFSDEEVALRCAMHEHGDLEQELYALGNEELLRSIGAEFGLRDAATASKEQLLAHLKSKKTRLAVELSKRLAAKKEIVATMPSKFVSAIQRLRDLN